MRGVHKDVGCSAQLLCNQEGNVMKKRFITLLSALLLLTGCTNSADGSSSVTDSESSQNCITEYPEFTGLSLSEKAVNEYSTLNNKSRMPQIFCNNGDTVYFANPEDGLFLYSYDGNEAKCFSETAAFSLNYYDNSVYFLSPEYMEELAVWFLPMESRIGTPYRYDIESGTVTKLGDTLMSDLCVDENGIFGSITEDNGAAYIYRVDPQSGECERAYRGFGIHHIDGYELMVEDSSENDGLDILLVGDEKVRILTYVVPFYDCIHQGIYYYRDNNTGLSFHSLNFVSGEAKEMPKCSDYTVFDGKLLMIIKNKLYLYTGNDTERISVEPHKEGDSSALIDYNINYLYTANDKLYAVVSYSVGRTEYYFLARLNISFDEKYASAELIG